MAEAVVTIRTVDKGSREVQSFGQKLAGLGLQALGVTSALGAAQAGLDLIKQAAKAAWDTLNEGAALELSQSRFENLAASIGTTAAALNTDMRAATQGMMADAQMVSAASDIISLGLADSGDEVVRLSNLVGQLGWDMQTLTLTMANDSMLRLDALGLSMTDVKGRMEELQAAGVAADEAFDLAVIEAGEAKLEMLGSSADSTAGRIKQLTTVWLNARSVFAQTFAAGVAAQFEEVTGSAMEAGESINQLARLLALAVSSSLGPMLDSLIRLAELLPDVSTGAAVMQGEFAQTHTAAQDMAGGLDAAVVATEELTAANEEYAASVAAAIAAGETMIVTDKGLVAASDSVSMRMRAMAGLAEVAAAAMAKAADKSAAMADGMSALEDISADGLKEHAEAAEALAAAYEEAAGRMSQAFSAALEPGGGMDFGNVDVMAEAAWSMAQAFGLTVPELGNIGIALGEITPEMAEAAAKAAIFQEAFGNLLGQFQAGNLDTEGFMAAYNGLIETMQNNSLVEIQVQLKQVENPARELWAWLPKEERQVVEVGVEFKPEEAALAQAIGVIDGIPDDQQKLISFEAEYTEVETAVSTIEADIAAIDATVLMTPETSEVDAAIQRIDQSRLTVFVDYVSTNAPDIPGRAAGGPVTGGAPYWVGEAGPELFVPWTHGSIIPNDRIGGGAGEISVTVNIYGNASAAEVGRAVDSAGRRLLERARQAGVAR